MTGPVHRDRLQCHAVAAALAFLLLVSATSAAADAADAAAKLGVAVQQALKGQDAGRVESYQGLPATLDSLNATSADAANMGSSNSTWRNAMYGNVTSVTPNSSASDREQTARERLRWGAELRSYLEAVFAGRPEYLQRIQKAWGIEQRDAFRLGSEPLPCIALLHHGNQLRGYSVCCCYVRQLLLPCVRPASELPRHWLLLMVLLMVPSSIWYQDA